MGLLWSRVSLTPTPEIPPLLVALARLWKFFAACSAVFGLALLFYWRKWRQKFAVKAQPRVWPWSAYVADYAMSLVDSMPFGQKRWLQDYLAVTLSQGLPVKDVREWTFMSLDHTTVTVRSYYPQGCKLEDELPTIVYFHGGGWNTCSIETHDQQCRRLCLAAHSVVASVEYRLAPEHPFPAGLHDCFEATKFVSRGGINTPYFKVNGSKLVVAGDSAGGNLALAVTMRSCLPSAFPTFTASSVSKSVLHHTCATCQDFDVDIAGQILIYPVLLDDFDAASYQEYSVSGLCLNEAIMRYHFHHYLIPPSASDMATLPSYFVSAPTASPNSSLQLTYADVASSPSPTSTSSTSASASSTVCLNVGAGIVPGPFVHPLLIFSWTPIENSSSSSSSSASSSRPANDKPPRFNWELQVPLLRPLPPTLCISAKYDVLETHCEYLVEALANCPGPKAAAGTKTSFATKDSGVCSYVQHLSYPSFHGFVTFSDGPLGQVEAVHGLHEAGLFLKKLFSGNL